MTPPTCGAGEVLAVQDGCYACVDPETCEEPCDKGESWDPKLEACCPDAIWIADCWCPEGWTLETWEEYDENGCLLGYACGCEPGPQGECCDPTTEPGVGGNPICFEGHACCPDGTWSCSIGDGKTFPCSGELTQGPFGEACEDLCEGFEAPGCTQSGCPAGHVCDPTVGCNPSYCGCDAATGDILCTDDCGGGTCVPEEPVGCCDPTTEPGVGGNPICFEGHACCPDGTWSCSIGDGKTFPCSGELTQGPFGEACEDLCEGFEAPGCTQSGCPAGHVCDPTVGCNPSACGCDPTTGDIFCTADCGGGTCVPKEPADTIFCGGIAGIPCPTGLTCIDDPDDQCSPTCGGADCGGICVEVDPAFCGGFAGFPCPAGGECVDAKGDQCSPLCGGADCGGMCVGPSTNQPCGGFLGLACPQGLICVDSAKDTCDPDCNGADCGGFCAAPVPSFCGGIAGIPCPSGQTCVDDPSDSCDSACGGADCGGQCVTIASGGLAID